MAEGDTILSVARRIGSALAGQQVSVAAGNRRGRVARLEWLDQRRLDRVEARGKHLLLHFGDLILHSHLGMSGSWQVCRRGERWRKPAAAAWAVIETSDRQAVQFGGPTLRVISAAQLRRDPTLARLGPDVLVPGFEPSAAAAAIRAAPDRQLGEALLDQRLVAGIGNIFKSEACFAAKVSPWRRVDELGEETLREVLASANRLMRASVDSGRPDPEVYGRAGRPCPVCRTPLAARGQGDANRRTYWCPRCQPGQSGESRAK